MKRRVLRACRVALALAPAVGCGEDAPVGPAGGASEAGDEVDVDVDERVARIQALGYADVGDALDDGASTGVLVHDRRRAVPGLNLFTTSGGCLVQIIDMDGAVLHAWSVPECARAGNAVLLPNGDLLVNGRRHREEGLPGDAYVARLSWDGELLWKTEVDAHHDSDMLVDGRLATLGARTVEDPELDPEYPIRDQLVTLLSPAGEVLEELSVLDVVRSAPGVELLDVQVRRRFGVMQVDSLHVNTLEFGRHEHLFDRHPLYGPHAVLLSSRHQDLVIAFDVRTGEVLWHWGQDDLSGPHDATRLENGNVLIFDNGLRRQRSRVIEIDPLTNEVVRIDDGGDELSFYTTTHGAAQRLSNGNTIVCESRRGGAYELTPEGDVVWEFLNPNVSPGNEPYSIVRLRRLEHITFEGLLEHVAAGTVPRVD